jgi:hypothetical protein
VASGCLLRRLTGHAPHKQAEQRIRAALGHRQYALTKGAIEKLVRRVRLHLDEGEDHALVALDASNAFNTTSRAVMFERVARHLPGRSHAVQLLHRDKAAKVRARAEVGGERNAKIDRILLSASPKSAATESRKVVAAARP